MYKFEPMVILSAGDLKMSFKSAPALKFCNETKKLIVLPMEISKNLTFCPKCLNCWMMDWVLIGTPKILLTFSSWGLENKSLNVPLLLNLLLLTH